MKYLKLLLILCLVACTATKPTTSKVEVEDNPEFTQFLDTYFKDAIEASYLTMHFKVADLEKYHLEKPEPILEPLKASDYETYLEDAKEKLEKLTSFEQSTLSESQQVDYAVLERSLKNAIVLTEYPMLDFHFSSNGVTDDTITALMEYEFRDKQDFDDYISVLKSVPAYFDSALELTKQQTEQGYFISDYAFEETIASIDRVLSRVDDNELIVDFAAALESADLTEGEKTALKKEQQQIVVEMILPSFQHVKDTLTKLKGDKSYLNSIADYEPTHRYYEAYLQYLSSNSKTLDENYQLLLDAITLVYSQIRTQNIIVTQEKMEEAYQKVTFEDASAMIDYAKEHTLTEFPEGPNVSYTVSYLDPTIANANVMAYYLQPPIDKINDNIIRVNPAFAGESVHLYATLAHEGYPGHLYQITYYLNTNPHPFRSLISHIGYVEGWAMLAQKHAYDYLTQMDDNIREIVKLDSKLGYYLPTLCDIAVNGYGDTEEELVERLKPLGLDSIASTLYEAVLKNPGQIVPYGMGYAQMNLLEEEAKTQLGDKFDAKSFYKAILDNGDRPFELVEKDVHSYIDSVK